MALSDQLVSFWKLDEASNGTRNDSVGSNHLTDNNADIAQTTGKIGNGIQSVESAGGSYLKCADNASLSLTGNLTIVAWVNRDAAPTFDFPAIAGKWATGQASYSLRYRRPDDRFYFSVTADGSTLVNAPANSFGAPATGTWYFVVGFVDVDNDIIGISVNDGTVDTTAFTGSVFDGTADFEIGRLGSSTEGLKGKIDAVGLWSRRLSTAEITELYNGGTGKEFPFGDLTVANAAHAHSAPNIDLDTGVHNLVAQNAAHAHTGQSVPFGSGSTLFNNCTASWKLSDLTDATGRGHNLTNSNSVAFSTGKIDNAAYFVRTSSKYLSAPSHVDFQLGLGDYTIAFWAWLDSVNVFQSLVSKDSNVATREYHIDLDSDAKFKFSAFNSSGTEIEVAANNFGAASTGQWYCVICWYDSAADTINISVNDGTANSTGVATSLLATPGNAEFRIGSRAFAGFEGYTNGRIDNVNLIKRKWSAGERTEFYNAGAGIEFTPGAPIADASFDQVRLELESVMLDSSQSQSFSSLTRLWTQVSGTAVEINNPSSINPTFIAPDVATPTDLVFKVTVTNAESLSAEDEVTVTIVPTGSTTWLWHTPQEAGMDAEEFYAALNSPGMLAPSIVIRNGRILGTKGDVTLEGLCWSASKQICALLFARELQLANVALTGVVPGSDNPTAPTATFEQFLAMVSDFQLTPHDPGTQYAYNNAACHHYGTYLKDTFYPGDDHVEMLQNSFVTALDFEDTLTYAGFMSGWDGGWSLSTRDLARICQLVLQDGAWDAVQLLDEDFISALYTNKVPDGATEHPDLSDPFINENGVTQQLPGAFSYGWWLGHVKLMNGSSTRNETIVMSGAFGTSAFISRQKNLIVASCNVGGTTINDNTVKIAGATFDLFSDALPEQRASSRFTRGSLHGFFDDEPENRSEFWASIAATPLAIQSGTHAHTATSLALTQIHELVGQGSTHAHTAEEITFAFDLTGSFRLRRGALHVFFDDEELNRTEVWEVATESTLTFQSAAHTHTADSLTLAQTHALAIQAASHEHTAENLGLTQVHELVTQSSDHSHSAESLTLTQTHSLSVTDSLHVHLADALALTQMHGLAVTDAAHAHAAESIGLTQIHQLVIDSAAHSHASESLAIAQVHQLLITDSAHLHAADDLALTQAHGLVIDDAPHTHTADNAVMVQAHQLAIANSSHNHTAESASLTQAHALTIHSAAHTHNAENVATATEGTLGIADSFHNHVAENTALTQLHLLAIENGGHAHAAESLVLVQVFQLTIADGQHLHTAESLVVTQSHVLTVQTGSHAYASENVALGAGLTLTIADAGHAHGAQNVLFRNIARREEIKVFSETRIGGVHYESRAIQIARESRIG